MREGGGERERESNGEVKTKREMKNVVGEIPEKMKLRLRNEQRERHCVCVCLKLRNKMGGADE